MSIPVEHLASCEGTTVESVVTLEGDRQVGGGQGVLQVLTTDTMVRVTITNLFRSFEITVTPQEWARITGSEPA